jgi:hypothetical protein
MLHKFKEIWQIQIFVLYLHHNRQATMEKDYRKELGELKDKERSLYVQISERLIELSQIYPDAIITQRANDGVKAMCLTKNYIGTISVEEQVTFIEKIEEWCKNAELKV